MTSVLCNNIFFCYCYFLLISATMSISNLTPGTSTCWVAGKSYAEKECGAPGGHRPAHEPAMSPCTLGPTASWAAFGRAWPAAQRRGSSPSAQPWGDTSGVPRPVLDSPVQKRHGFTGLSPVKGHEFIAQKEVTAKSDCCIIKSSHQQYRLYLCLSASVWDSQRYSQL